MAHISNISNIANVRTQLLLINPKINQSPGLSEKLSWFSPEKTCNKCKIFWPRTGNYYSVPHLQCIEQSLGMSTKKCWQKLWIFLWVSPHFSPFVNAEVCGLALPCSAFGALLQGVGCGVAGSRGGWWILRDQGLMSIMISGISIDFNLLSIDFPFKPLRNQLINWWERISIAINNFYFQI